MRKWINTAVVAALVVGGWLVAPTVARQAELYGEYMELYGPMCWGPDTSGCVEIDAPNSGTASNRTFFRGDMTWAGTGIADAAHDFLTADQSTMMSTPETFLSASVTVDEQGDTVIVSVSGRWAWMGEGIFVLDANNPDSVWTCTLALVCNEAELPSGFGFGQGITASGGMLYVADAGNPDSVWTCTLVLACNEAVLPSGFGDPGGIAASGGMLYVADVDNPDSVWTCTLALVCNEAVLPSGFGIVRGITASGGMLYVVDADNPDSVWTCTLALVCTEATLPNGFGDPGGIAASGGMLYVADVDNQDSVWTCTLALVCTEAELPSGFGNVQGIASSGDAPCEWRIARDATEVESIDLNEGVPTMLLDGLTVIDRPAPGTYTYSAQMSTSTPETVCTAYFGGGVTPVPSLLVQVVYGS